MNKDEPNKGNQFADQVGSKAARKLHARRNNPANNVWFGLGMMGLIGWSVVIPTLLGAVLGLWIDNNHPGGRSWTLALLIAGLSIGCLNAWHWVSKEEKAIHQEQNKNQDDE
jgi:ATP synthase protein I